MSNIVAAKLLTMPPEEGRRKTLCKKPDLSNVLVLRGDFFFGKIKLQTHPFAAVCSFRWVSGRPLVGVRMMYREKLKIRTFFPPRCGKVNTKSVRAVESEKHTHKHKEMGKTEILNVPVYRKI